MQELRPLLVIRGFARLIIQATRNALNTNTDCSVSRDSVLLQDTIGAIKAQASLCKHAGRKAEREPETQAYSELWILLHYYRVFGRIAESLGGVT